MKKARTAATVAVWALFIIYVAFIIYISTAFLPPEDPADDGPDDKPKPPPTNSTGGSTGSISGTPVEPRQTPVVLRPVYYLRDNLPNFDFFANVGIYLIFGAIAFLALGTVPRFDWRSVLMIAVLLGLILSIILELYQTSLAYRVGDYHDVTYNVLGTFLGATALYLVSIKRDKKEKSMILE